MATKQKNKTAARRSPITPAEARDAVLAVEAHGGLSQAASALNVKVPWLQRRLRKADVWGISAHGEITASVARRLPRPSGGPARYILTAAQSNTKVHPELWENLKALAEHYHAEIMVGRIRYNHTAWQIGQEAVKRSADSSLWYDDALEAFFCDERVEIAPGLLWVGDMNIIPTATDPLSGLDSFAGSPSCIFPHPQVALKSVATAPGTDTKILYTTGAATLKNYIKRKAGLKAEFHHAYAALIVEVDSAGDWFVRQINADTNGVVHDLDLRVEGGKVATGQQVLVLTPGDIHGTEVDPVALQTVWGDGGLIDVLQPAHQVLHDVLNFGRRSHHNTVFDLIAAHYNRAESVEGEIEGTAAILNRILRPGVATHVVKANHDEHFDRWVREADFRRDPVNAAFYLEAAGQKVAALKRGDLSFDLAEWALKRAGLAAEVRFLARDERLEIAGIRHDQHGDIGPNGARGSAANLSRTGEKSNIGHSHSARIYHGCYQMGTMSLLDMGYNQGPSSWSHSLIVTYGNGKRTIITLKNGKWRAA
ncbi:hypothetical protein GFB49_11680 [Epibacterium sp. SM1979]|uniref:DNA binding HTH domain-containing protein n=1 Tax=Tritonibacter litoralis TaxID=2662264 RepID=A0A843YK94_9RHOB|nr:hypothetical protein [Tritonibacter litoralis]MQQ09117.1 hypothetical protein [Tritonibacter litoralis]